MRRLLVFMRMQLRMLMRMRIWCRGRREDWMVGFRHWDQGEFRIRSIQRSGRGMDWVLGGCTKAKGQELVYKVKGKGKDPRAAAWILGNM